MSYGNKKCSKEILRSILAIAISEGTFKTSLTLSQLESRLESFEAKKIQSCVEYLAKQNYIVFDPGNPIKGIELTSSGVDFYTANSKKAKFQEEE